MNKSPMLLIGIGTAGSAIARGINRAFSGELRYVLADTDANSGSDGGPFVLLGGERLSGLGAGGDIVAGRLAAESSIKLLDEHLEGVRLAVIVTSLGGGTGGGATLEAAKHLAFRGIPSIVFASTPFSFEGEERQRNSRGIMSMIEDAASASFFLPLDKLVAGIDNMDEAMRRAVDTVASGVTLFWRLVEKPGYIRLDTERLRHILSNAGRGRFAAVTVQGPNRSVEAIDQLIRSEMLAAASAPVNSILCGVLAGEDLRLSEIGVLADGIRSAFGERHSFELATVNDEATFCGRLSVVVMLFETSRGNGEADKNSGVMSARKRRDKNPLGIGPSGRGRFKNAEPTIWNGEDLDIPTFIRRNINLEF
jgi:cell division protein FtsZ